MAIARVRGAHYRATNLNSQGFKSPRPANDPSLQLWVAATLYATGIQMHIRVFGSVSSSFAEEALQEFAVIATSLNVTPELWPADCEAFWKYYEGEVASLQVSNDARMVVKDLLWNKNLPWWVRWMASPLARVLVVEWLPDEIRKGYGWKRTWWTGWIRAMLVWMLKTLYVFLPLEVRTLSVRYSTWVSGKLEERSG